ncbi:hypothetical protein P5673_003099 [Acropora cervicornis]|uniref:Secreted protein n=1 Tax=Acropora cervicornis TaxID=6130 RepID=A0AAD9R230_ACRCE|nr:hypothetical protein P5673_003099 [Acropora cervicornis]
MRILQIRMAIVSNLRSLLMALLLSHVTARKFMKSSFLKEHQGYALSSRDFYSCVGSELECGLRCLRDERSPIRSLFVKSGTFGILATVSVRVARAIRGSNVKQRNLVISPQTPATPVNTSGTLKTPVQTGSTGLTPRKTETL